MENINQTRESFLFVNLQQGLQEVIGDYLDSESHLIDEAIGGFKDPVERENSDLHIRMAKAAVEVYLNTVTTTKQK